MNEVSESALAPLSRAEARRAIAAATKYLEPELILDGRSRYRVLGAELSLTRPSKQGDKVARRTEVLIVDYLGRRQVRLSVERGRVVEVRDAEGQAAFAPEEVAEAQELASQVPELNAIARRRGVFSSPFASGSSDTRSRRIGLHFVLERREAQAVVLATAEIDLMEQRLVSYEVSAAGHLVADGGGSRGSVR